MAYKDRAQDRRRHRDKMRERRRALKLNGRFVTPNVTPVKADADGNPIYEE